MSEQKDIDQIGGEATPNPDDTNMRPPVGQGPGLPVPDTAEPEETGLGSGPGS